MEMYRLRRGRLSVKGNATLGAVTDYLVIRVSHNHIGKKQRKITFGNHAVHTDSFCVSSNAGGCPALCFGTTFELERLGWNEPRFH